MYYIIIYFIVLKKKKKKKFKINIYEQLENGTRIQWWIKLQNIAYICQFCIIEGRKCRFYTSCTLYIILVTNTEDYKFVRHIHDRKMKKRRNMNIYLHVLIIQNYTNFSFFRLLSVIRLIKIYHTCNINSFKRKRNN